MHVIDPIQCQHVGIYGGAHRGEIVQHLIHPHEVAEFKCAAVIVLLPISVRLRPQRRRQPHHIISLGHAKEAGAFVGVKCQHSLPGRLDAQLVQLRHCAADGRDVDRLCDAAVA
eukprot:CAMPEP_0119359040 /NCGR_PEP_ID=MMETSP1334-20130426/7036_1 /TAXON_ID=127549 /ORGANISM="Calcidiscus leptoporus, Strain RCC1130" /LENGTH=113 /DNA_ID=CAMNT_0007373631 /DNA_START=573 /DNA_END=914 /DNA_ORIENTATION=+